MKKLLSRLLNRETILYLFFGVLTTLINFVVFDRCNYVLGERYAVVSQIAVLSEQIEQRKTLQKELPTFFGGRTLSFAIETLLVLAARDVFHAGQYTLLGINGLTVAKAPISVIVVVLNYVFSKVFVFRKK